MENHVSFKVYLNKGGGGDCSDGQEVRRFGIDSDVATSFSYLIEKLKSVFPCLRDVSTIQVFWKDAENDMVKICSDAELIIALTEMDGQIKKLFIDILPESSAAQDSEPQDIIITADIPLAAPPVIICDGCNTRLSGFRYKCLQCPDYDLCPSCEAKQLHGDHFMLRMPSPNVVKGGRICDCSGKKKGKCCFDVVGREMLDSKLGYGCPFVKKHSKKGKRHGHYRCPEDIISFGNNVLYGRTRNLATNLLAQAFVPETSVTTETRKCESAAKTATPPTWNVPTTGDSAASPPTGMPKADSSSAAAPGNQISGQDVFGDIMTNLCPLVNNLLNQNVPIVRDILADCFQNITGEIQKNTASTSQATDNKESTNDTSNGNVEKETVSTSKTTNTSDNHPAENTNDKHKENHSGKTQNLSVNITHNENDSVSSGNIKTPATTPDLVQLSVSDMEKLLKELYKLSMPKAAEDVNGERPSAPPAPTSAAERESSPKEKSPYHDDGIRVTGVETKEKEESDEEWTVLNGPQPTDSKVEDQANGFAGNKGGAIPKTFNEPTVKTPQEPTASNTNKDKKTENENADSTSSSNAPDPFADSLRRLLAMGFTNEGNWLRELLVNHKGDLAAVIDQLLPPRPEKNF